MNTSTQSRIARLLIALLLCAAPAFLAACQTIEGAGKDIQSAGEAIEDAADGEDE